jgi:hypothetical protein
MNTGRRKPVCNKISLRRGKEERACRSRAGASHTKTSQNSRGRQNPTNGPCQILEQAKASCACVISVHAGRIADWQENHSQKLYHLHVSEKHEVGEIALELMDPWPRPARTPRGIKFDASFDRDMGRKQSEYDICVAMDRHTSMISSYYYEPQMPDVFVVKRQALVSTEYWLSNLLCFTVKLLKLCTQPWFLLTNFTELKLLLL